MVKEGFTTTALRSYVPQFVKETEDYIKTSPRFKGDSGVCNITEVLGEITIYTASSSLQGREVRSKFDGTFARLYRHLDDAFQPINFMLPGLPLPQNRRRDHAQQVMEQLYGDIVRRRRAEGNAAGETDMIWTLMDARYKDGTPMPDAHIARLMIALLMGGQVSIQPVAYQFYTQILTSSQHNTAASGAWAVLELAHQPGLVDELYREQLAVLGSPLPPLTLEGLQKLTLGSQVIKETLRLHSPIHSILRRVKRPMRVPDSDGWVVPPSHTLLAATGFPARSHEFSSGRSTGIRTAGTPAGRPTTATKMTMRLVTPRQRSTTASAW